MAPSAPDIPGPQEYPPLTFGNEAERTWLEDRAAALEAELQGRIAGTASLTKKVQALQESLAAETARSGELAAELEACRRVESEYQALLQTRIIRWSQGPRRIYGRVRAGARQRHASVAG